MIGGFAGAFVLNFALMQFVDRRKTKAHPLLVALNPMRYPAEYFLKDGQAVLAKRDACLKAFYLAVGVLAILAVIAAAADIKFG